MPPLSWLSSDSTNEDRRTDDSSKEGLMGSVISDITTRVIGSPNVVHLRFRIGSSRTD